MPLLAAPCLARSPRRQEETTEPPCDVSGRRPGPAPTAADAGGPALWSQGRSALSPRTGRSRQWGRDIRTVFVSAAVAGGTRGTGAAGRDRRLFGGGRPVPSGRGRPRG